MNSALKGEHIAMERMRKFWKLIFGRTGILIILMLIQAVILFGGFAILDNSTWMVNYIISILAIIILIYILNAQQNSSFKLMWIILILLVPIVGVVFYLYTKMQPGTAFISGTSVVDIFSALAPGNGLAAVGTPQEPAEQMKLPAFRC